MSGGGTLGAFEAGVLYGFTHSDKEDDFHYDVFSGVSAGSINSAVLSHFPKGQDKEASEYLPNVWSNFTTESWYVSWPGGIKEGILKQAGLFDDSNLLDTLGKVIDDLPHNDFQRPASFASTDIVTGEYVVYD